MRYSPWICPFWSLLSRLPQLEKLVFQARIIYDSEVENLNMGSIGGHTLEKSGLLGLKVMILRALDIVHRSDPFPRSCQIPHFGTQNVPF